MNPGNLWTRTSDAELLQDLFGFLPTFREAYIREIAFPRHADGLRIVLDYTDTGIHADEPLTVRLQLDFARVEQCDLRIQDSYVYGLELRQRDGLIQAEFHQGAGFSGLIYAESFDLSLVQVAPESDIDEEGIRVTFA